MEDKKSDAGDFRIITRIHLFKDGRIDGAVSECQA